jgi:cytochrome c oxidase cbb3-type subunit 1
MRAPAGAAAKRRCNMNYFKLVILGIVALVAAMGMNWGHDLAYKVHAFIIMAVAAGMFFWVLRRIDEPVPAPEVGYADGVIRAGVIATAFWGVIGFLVGTFIAFQLAFPELNFDWGQPFTNFGRLRPLHTNAAIFAFVGNMMFAGVYYSTQRLCRVRMASDLLSKINFWG